MVRLGLAWLVSAFVVLAATSAYPQHRAGDLYAGAALGMAWHPELEGDLEGFENEIRRVESADFNFLRSDDTRASAWSVYAGYAVNEIFAIEAGYLGSDRVSAGLSASGTLEGEPLRFGFDAQARRWSLYGALVAHAPIDSSVKPFFKIGVRRWEDEVRVTLRHENSRETKRDDGVGLLLGAGVGMPVSEAVSLRLEYLYLPLGSDHGGDEHRSQLGMHYTF